MIFKYCTLVFILIISARLNTVQAQPENLGSKSKQLVETPILFTDREIYSVNEDILFSALNISSVALLTSDWSNVLYVELVSPDGEAFCSRKFSYNKNGATGVLRIPNSILTGNYYLRAYTRWMRDYSPYNFFYKIVTVINPFRGELLEPSENTVISEADVKTTLVSSDDLHLKTDKKIYEKRKEVKLVVSSIDDLDSSNKYVVSVVPKGTGTPLTPNLSGLQELKFSPDFIPETRGLSISGKVVNLSDSVPIPYMLVALTIFKEKAETRNIMTNEKGQFFFDLSKLNGEYEIFISAKPKGNQTPLILIDNDFSTQELKLPYIAMDLSEEKKEIYKTLIFNSQIQALYQKRKIEDNLKSFSSDSLFYGVPDFVLNFADYIALTNVKDYIYELIPQVGVRHDGKRTTLKVLGSYSELSIYDPLVLVDMVPIFDIDKVLALQPGKIDRIEVVTSPYITGNIVFGGIVSLFSKKGDLAGIDLPSTGRFITYNMLSSDSIQILSQGSQHVPDLRSCIYWNPNLELKRKEPAIISFNTNDNIGDYLITVRSIDRNGKSIVATTEFSVK